MLGASWLGRLVCPGCDEVDDAGWSVIPARALELAKVGWEAGAELAEEEEGGAEGEEDEEVTAEAQAGMEESQALDEAGGANGITQIKGEGSGDHDHGEGDGEATGDGQGDEGVKVDVIGEGRGIPGVVGAEEVQEQEVLGGAEDDGKKEPGHAGEEAEAAERPPNG